MKGLSLIAAAALAFTCSLQLFAQTQSGQSPVLPPDSKVKVKDGKTTVRDKSKPVRQAIETWKKTEEGWKLYKVDNIRDRGLLVDDKPYNPN